ncbi:hypothetical protein TRFO_23468 [Tritrichomonas foetus]|uniref:DUF3447 domain-containing protein n=1 Tax=Tritrichomonas foetus TaxID=1144522 RepID=A0A1J4KFG2_9EUKA|nr:hypothetical protein TRFO_23468 [Tritrichomonas foetus]|eukprot:OHT08109.1 hypothetical protein TRFO_23468 [Tritrichomonas foetus]
MVKLRCRDQISIEKPNIFFFEITSQAILMLSVEEFLETRKERHEIITEFQDKLNWINSDSFDECREFIENKKSFFFNDKESAYLFASTISCISIYNFKNVEYLCDLASYFKPQLFMFFNEYDIYSIFSDFMLTCFLYQRNVLSIETIYVMSYSSPVLFAMFYPELKQYDPEFVEKCENFDIPKDPDFVTFYQLEEFQNLLSNAKNHPALHIEHRKNFYHPSELAKAIREDDIDTFQNILSDQNISVHGFLPYSFYERTKTIDKYVSYIQYAAVYGSLNIFKFLWVNDAECSENLNSYAYSGRNYDIIHICETRFQMKNAMLFAINTFQYDLIEYLKNNGEKITLYDLLMSMHAFNYKVIREHLKTIVENLDFVVDNVGTFFNHFTDLDLARFLFFHADDSVFQKIGFSHLVSSTITSGIVTFMTFVLSHPKISPLNNNKKLFSRLISFAAKFSINMLSCLFEYSQFKDINLLVDIDSYMYNPIFIKFILEKTQIPPGYSLIIIFILYTTLTCKNFDMIFNQKFLNLNLDICNELLVLFTKSEQTYLKRKLLDYIMKYYS